MDYYEKILENHNCRLIEKDGCYITWKNPKGTVFTDDQVLCLKQLGIFGVTNKT